MEPSRLCGARDRDSRVGQPCAPDGAYQEDDPSEAPLAVVQAQPDVLLKSRSVQEWQIQVPILKVAVD